MYVWFQNLAHFSEKVGLGVLLVYLYGVFARKGAEQWVIDCSLGIIFGLASLTAMSNPITLADGVIVDLRNMFVGVAAAYFGWRGGVLCAVIAIAARYALGGTGSISGIVSIIIALAMGLLWLHVIRPKNKNHFISSQVLAALISVYLLGGLLLPSDLYASFYPNLAPLMVIANFAGVNIFGILISRERSLVGEAKLLEKQAMTDPLTQILNRRSAIAAYRSLQCGRPPKRGIAMTCIDVDNFKSINDTYGHNAGDQVLQDIAHRIGLCIRPKDIFCRMSGDEFLFVLTNVTSEEARNIAERCRSIVARVPVTTDEADIAVSISLGTVWSPQPMHFEEFRSKADEVLYAAKHKGRNHAAFDIESVGAPYTSVAGAA